MDIKLFPDPSLKTYDSAAESATQGSNKKTMEQVNQKSYDHLYK
jgi:hypothetical protein